MEDPQCTSPQDNTENQFTPGRTQCSNGMDDDRDGWIDMWDPGCTSQYDNTENTL